MRNAGRGPSFERYLTGMPGGLDAHPGAQAKGSLVRNVLEGQPPEVLRRLPAVLQPFVADPPMDSEWVPEVRLCALIHAVAEQRRYSVAEVLAWIRQRNLALFSSPLYRLLMSVVSPEAMLRHAGKRWGNFHRGSSLEFEGFSDDGARVTLTHPAGLYDELVLGAYGAAFAAALEVARAKAPQVSIEISGPGFARYLARW